MFLSRALERREGEDTLSVCIGEVALHSAGNESGSEEGELVGGIETGRYTEDGRDEVCGLRDGGVAEIDVAVGIVYPQAGSVVDGCPIHLCQSEGAVLTEDVMFE